MQKTLIWTLTAATALLLVALAPAALAAEELGEVGKVGKAGADIGGETLKEGLLAKYNRAMAANKKAADEGKPKPQAKLADVGRREVMMVKMRDEVELACDVYIPHGEGPWPVWFMRGPYGRIGYGIMFGGLSNGMDMVYVTQDMRGRFDSPGNDSVVFLNDGIGEARDGHDTLQWIAQQPWCDGRIAMWGGSALGITQTLLLPDAPKELKAVWARWPVSSFYDQCAYQGGVFRRMLVGGWLQGIKADPETLKEYLAHDKDGKFWDAVNPEKFAHRVNTPGVFAGGWFDIFNQGTINCFTAFHNKGGPGARGKCRLVMAPLAHGKLIEIQYPKNSRAPGSEPQEGYTPPASFNPMAFYDYHWFGVDNGVSTEKPVHYYVMGDPEDPEAPGNYWRGADNWPPPSDPTNLYLNKHGTLTWSPPESADTKRTYEYDPNDPVPTIGGMNMIIDRGPMDQRSIETRDDVLVFTTEVLTEPIEITGRIWGTIYISSDRRDTDFTVKFCDVYPDGRSMVMNDGILRAKFREGFDKYRFLKKGRVYELTVDLWSTSLVVNAGHKIRIAVSSSNYPRFDINPNNGGRVQDMGDLLVATNTVHFSSEYPSHVILPIYTGPTNAPPKKVAAAEEAEETEIETD